MSLHPHQRPVDRVKGKEREIICFKGRLVKVKARPQGTTAEFHSDVPSLVHTVAPSAPAKVTLLNTGPLNRRPAVRGVHVELLHAVLSCPPIGPWPDDVA